MSSQTEEKNFTDQLTETNGKAQQKPMITYSRDFLLSFSDLEVCKTLPSGFDRSLLSEFEDFSHDRQRIPGNVPSNTYRRTEYGSSPPTRGDLTSQSRGIQGRWESRSSGRSDKDSDSQSDWDPEPGRRYGNQSRRAWQNPEHDGLLGSGSFPRPSGFAAGSSAPKARPNEPYQLAKSTEPYQPPRPYKAVPHGRRDTDAFNNETFGSSEDTNDDRSEDERKRRASFELMRKEQHRALQDNQKSNPAKIKDGFDFATLVGESKDEMGSLKRDIDSDEAVKPLALDKDSDKFTALAQRPLVPPGFASSLVDRGVGAKSVNHTHASEAGNSEIVQFLHGKNKSGVISTSDDQEQHGSMIGSHVSNILYDKTNTSQAFQASKGSEVIEPNTKKANEPSVLVEPSQDNSLLDKLFGSALALNDSSSSNVLERHGSKEKEAQIPNSFPSSKFARWFHEEEKVIGTNRSSGQSNDLLSMIVGGNKNDQFAPNLPFQNPQNMDKLIKSKVGSFDQSHKDNIAEPIPAVLTCEDLEQSILSEIKVNPPNLPPAQIWTDHHGKSEQTKPNPDNLASQHLLSLLQKGTSLNNTAESSSKVEDSRTGKVSDAGNSLTLETLFGSAFMEELQSVGAPVSSQRGSKVESSFHGLDGEIGFRTSSVHDVNVRRQNRVDTIEEPWLKFDDPQAKPNYVTQVGFKPLPEENSLIANRENFLLSGNSVNPDLLSSNSQVNVPENLAAFNSGFRDDRMMMRGAQEQAPFHHGPFNNVRESNHSYQNPNAQHSFAQLHHQQRNNMGVLFPNLDPRPVNMNPRDAVPNHQAHHHMLRPPMRHISGVEQPIPHPLLQHMHGNGPPNLLQGYNRGPPMPAHSNRGGPIPAHSNFGGNLGMPLPASELGGGGNNAEALQRLMEMEARLNPKQVHPFPGSELDMGFGFR